MDPQYSAHLVARAALAFAAAAALLGVRHSRLRFLEPGVYAALAAVAVAAFFSFGPPFHGWNRGFTDRWEQFHYQLGSKYFPELGYDGLYVASLLAQAESDPDRFGNYLRDLRTNVVVHPARLAEHASEVRARFDDERWASFVADHALYLNGLYPGSWDQIRRDHGYNPTPTWTFVARLFSAKLPATDASLAFLGSLDALLLAAIFAVLLHVYGWRVACLALVVAGLCYGWRHLYNGTFLRLDWLAASVIGVCLLQRERFAAAGALLGYATMSRLFPVALLAGPALLAWKDWRAGRWPSWAVRVGAGFGAALCLGLLAGCFAGRGPAAWSEFASNIQLHRHTYATSRWGLETVVLHDPAFLVANLDGPAPRLTHREARQKLDERRLVLSAARGAMLALFARAAWRASLVGSTVLSLAVLYALAAAGTYYWIIAMLIPLRPGIAMPVALLLLSAAGNLLHLGFRGEAYDAFRTSLMSWGLGVLLVGWLLPDAWRTLKGRR